MASAGLQHNDAVFVKARVVDDFGDYVCVQIMGPGARDTVSFYVRKSSIEPLVGSPADLPNATRPSLRDEHAWAKKRVEPPPDPADNAAPMRE